MPTFTPRPASLRSLRPRSRPRPLSLGVAALLGAWAGVFAMTGLPFPMGGRYAGQAAPAGPVVQPQFGLEGWGGIADQPIGEASDASAGVEPMRFEIEFEPVATDVVGVVLGSATDAEDPSGASPALAVGESVGE